ncbi:hypothetical protein [Mesorhizobium sp.]|uniref:hypothetical protein n=1 Tax=Mesorhizobium sp. TaxID=1871066 RepID=UPI000FE4B588|nr:hypothetical protein [Mesorhizobium sp.]RWC59489.1 MAG: hypothetical protein EOS29_21925 [Mesorhizobium sp.]RWC60470.1 MAG: hypothetical protein EOS56_14365 [Mesorhizobium sp.]
MKRKRITERQLDEAFAERLIADAKFRTWVLQPSKFASLLPEVRLLHEELSASRRMAVNSWRHVWCTLPDRTQGETDIFAVFETRERYRFSVHIENKPPRCTLRKLQAENYPKRAAFLAGHPRYLKYEGYETVIMAPGDFIANEPRCEYFDRPIRYEEVAAQIPLFAEALRG